MKAEELAAKFVKQHEQEIQSSLSSKAGYETDDKGNNIFSDSLSWKHCPTKDSDYRAELKILAKDLLDEESLEEYRELYELSVQKRKTDLREHRRVSEMMENYHRTKEEFEKSKMLKQSCKLKQGHEVKASGRTSGSKRFLRTRTRLRETSIKQKDESDKGRVSSAEADNTALQRLRSYDSDSSSSPSSTNNVLASLREYDSDN